MPYIVSGAWTVDKSTAENSPRNCSVYSQVRTPRLAFLFFIFGWSPNPHVVLFSAVTVPTLNISAQYNVTGFSLCRFRLNAEHKQKTKKKRRSVRRASCSQRSNADSQAQISLAQSKLKALICQAAAWKYPFCRLLRAPVRHSDFICAAWQSIEPTVPTEAAVIPGADIWPAGRHEASCTLSTQWVHFNYTLTLHRANRRERRNSERLNASRKVMPFELQLHSYSCTFVCLIFFPNAAGCHTRGNPVAGAQPRLVRDSQVKLRLITPPPPPCSDPAVALSQPATVSSQVISRKLCKPP